jgi:hypothetical protein
MTKDHTPLIGGKPMEEWGRLWVRVPNGLKQHQSDLTGEVGLYRYILNGQTMALGTGTDRKGGIAKRLSDFIRSGWSGRDHHAGQLIFKHRDQLVVEVLLTGSGQQARAIARRLKAPMMLLHQPPWNPPRGASSSAGKAKAGQHQSVRKTMPRLGQQLRNVAPTGPSVQVHA